MFPPNTIDVSALFTWCLSRERGELEGEVWYLQSLLRSVFTTGYGSGQIGISSFVVDDSIDLLHC